jgi:hypothetical protein
MRAAPKTMPTNTSPEKPTKGKIQGAQWSGYPCEARLVSVVVGPSKWTWCKDMLGRARKAIEVRLDSGMTLYVDNEDGTALAVFLAGKAPLPGFRFVPPYVVRDDPDAKAYYQASFGP